VEDFDFDREIIHVREREEVPDCDGTFRLKNEGSQRTLRFAPMLQAILKPYFAQCGQAANQLAFPSPNGRNIVLTDTRKLIERVAAKAHALAPTATLKAEFANPAYFADSDHLFRPKSISRFAPCRSPSSVDGDQG
jgi:hypothetical protein